MTQPSPQPCSKPLPLGRFLLRARHAALLLGATACLLFTVATAPAAGDEDEEDDASPNERQTAIKALLDKPKSETEFDAAAKKSGLPPQTLIEAKVIWCVKHDQFSNVTAFADQLDKLVSCWKPEDAVMSKSPREAAGLGHFARALGAKEKGDAAAFEREVKEAFWSDPNLARMLADRVKTFQQEKDQEKIVFPMDTEFAAFSGSEKMTPRQLMKGKKALLIDFWETWCPYCITGMKDLEQRFKDLAPKGIAVIALNSKAADDSGERQSAAALKDKKSMTLPWLMEPKGKPLTTLLNVDSIPRQVLISPEGKVLFNGLPSDPALTRALAKLNVTLASAK